MTSRGKGGGLRTPALLLSFGLIFGILAVASSAKMSATFDEPMHLTAGYAALTRGDYRFGVGAHPPLIRMWAALPLTFTPGVRIDTASRAYRDGRQIAVAREFLYRDNDADVLLSRARCMIVLLGILLGIMVFFWARELYGSSTATGVLVMFCLEPNLMAHSAVVTTDIGLTLCFFAAVWFLFRSTRSLCAGNVAGLVLFFALGVVAKVSALLLVPIAAVGLLAYAWWSPEWKRTRDRPALLSRRNRLWAALSVLLLMGFAGWAAVWGSYRFRYALASDPGLRSEVVERWDIANVSPGVAGLLRHVDEQRLLPYGYTRGLLDQLSARQGPRYLAGTLSERNFPLFFPAVVALKTPSAILLLIAGGLALILLRREFRQSAWWFVMGPAAVYFLVAALGPVNTGVRHLLPVYPFLLLVAGRALHALIAGGRKVIVAGLCLLLIAEFAWTYPDCLASFNLLAGGPGRGERWLLDSNLDWGQGLKGLKLWMDRNQLEFINLSYFGQADPAYHGIQAIALPTEGNEAAINIKLPGYVAVSITNLYGLYGNRRLREFYRPLGERKPVAVIRRSIKVWWVESPWWQ